MFRDLRKNEVEARVAQNFKNGGVRLLLYKNARCDMNILDETVGAMNWERDHKEIKGRMYCGIGIYNKELDRWIWKWDCGSESNMQAEKGEASDSFKRAGFNWGIGRELYTAPDILFWANEVKDQYDKYDVTGLEIIDGVIASVEVLNLTTNVKKKFTQGVVEKPKTAKEAKAESDAKNEVAGEPITPEQLKELNALMKEKGFKLSDCDKIKKAMGIKNLTDLTQVQLDVFKNKIKAA